MVARRISIRVLGKCGCYLNGHEDTVLTREHSGRACTALIRAPQEFRE